MLLYHGSSLVVEEPHLIEQTRGLDFGSGFYLTSSLEQAQDYSVIIVNRRRKQGIPTVSVYDYDEAAAESQLRIKHFSSPDPAWLEFVRDNRLKVYDGKRYDVCIGPIADDNAFVTIQLLVSNQLSWKAAVIQLKPYKHRDQYCFATEKALSFLRFSKVLTREEGTW